MQQGVLNLQGDNIILVNTLLHKCSNGKPETIKNRELVFHDVRVGITGVRITPLVGREAGDDEHHKADAQVDGYDVDPHLCIQGRQEGE